jgi:hypothetical protein
MNDIDINQSPHKHYEGFLYGISNKQKLSNGSSY